MSQQTFILDLPQDVYERIRLLAESSHRPLESVVSESLSLLFRNAPSEVALADLAKYSDLDLWTVVYWRLSPEHDSRLTTLMDKGKESQLAPDEQAELESLVTEVNRQMLFRSEALMLLKQRGQDIDGYLKLWAT